MKKKQLILIFSALIFFFGQLYAQIQFSPHTISGGEFSAIGAKSVYAIDVDSDGDIDVLFASDSITWFENDGNQNFTVHTISTSVDDATSVFAIDVDGDNDMDVLYQPREHDGRILSIPRANDGVDNYGQLWTNQ